MNFDSLVFACVADELRRTLTDGRVEKIAQPLPLVLAITFYASGEKRTLSCVCDAGEARMHLISRRGRPNPPSAPAFCMLLRKYLEGAWLREITQPLGLSERVARFSFRTHDGKDYHLWLEIMGKQSNVVFTNDDGMILGAIKRVTPAMSRLREIRAGILYAPPPKQLGGRRDPFDPSAGAGLTELTFGTPQEASSWLMATFRGVGTGMAAEAVARATGATLTPENAWYGLNDLLNTVRLNEYAPVLWRDETGAVAGVYPVPFLSIPRERQERWKTVSAALEFAYETKEATDALTQEKTSLSAALRRALKAREREYLDVREGLLYSERANELKENADLLLANQSAVQKGMTEVVVEDFFASEENTTRTITLDEKLSVSENVERYIKKYKKARDSRVTLEARKSAVVAALAMLEEALPEAEAAGTAAELIRLTERLSAILPAVNEGGGGGRKAEASPFEGHKIKTYRSPDGWEVLVGENATSNDYLTTRLAAPSDIWLHARAVTSAHGIIRAKNRPAAVSSAAIRLAAEQVARRSQAKHARLVAIDYTLKKYVRKPRGGEPGQVLYTNEKTLDVVLED